MVVVSEWLLADRLELVVEVMVSVVRPIMADVGQLLIMVDGGVFVAVFLLCSKTKTNSCEMNVTIDLFLIKIKFYLVSGLLCFL